METFFDDLLCLWKSESSDGREILEDRDNKGISRWRGVLSFSQADLDAVADWGVPCYRHADGICYCCLANRTDYSYTDMRPCAKWVATEQLNHAAFLSRCNRSAHPLADSPYFS